MVPWQRLPFFVDLIRNDMHRLPKGWKPWNNDRVRVMADASAFVAAFKRLDRPSSTFLEWSRQGKASSKKSL